MNMSLRLLSYFVATVEAGSANRAAARLHITQPTLSRQLRQLETDLGVELFARAGRGLTLSRAGEDLLPLAKDLLGRAVDIERAARDMAIGRLERLHLAVPTTTLADVVAPFLAGLTEDDPVPIVHQLDPDDAESALRSGADLAIVTRHPGGGVSSRPLAALPLLAQMPADHELAGRAAVDLHDLVRHPLLLLTANYRPRTLIDAAVDHAGLGYDVVQECSHPLVAQAQAAAGRGVAVVSDDPRFDLSAAQISTATGTVRIRLFAAWLPGHHAEEALASFSARLSRYCVDRYGLDVAV